jgi:L-seryl-tRNA(Ser) seleniumtransferase
MRPDKATVAGVAATLGLYRAGLAAQEIPVWRMIAAPVEALRARAEALAARVAGATTAPLTATVGGGSLPGETLPSFGLALDGRPAASMNRLLAALRAGEPAVLGRIEGGRVVLDLRTVDPAADAELGRAIAAAMSVAGIRG